MHQPTIGRHHILNYFVRSFSEPLRLCSHVSVKLFLSTFYHVYNSHNTQSCSILSTKHEMNHKCHDLDPCLPSPRCSYTYTLISGYVAPKPEGPVDQLSTCGIPMGITYLDTTLSCLIHQGSFMSKVAPSSPFNHTQNITQDYVTIVLKSLLQHSYTKSYINTILF